MMPPVSTSKPSIMSSSSGAEPSAKPGQHPMEMEKGAAPSNTGARPGAGADDSASGSAFIKVFSLMVSDEGDEDGKVKFTEMPITSLHFPIKSASSFRLETKLQDVRAKLEKIIRKGQNFKFCADDCSAVPEELTLASYAKMLKSAPTASDGLMRVYIVASNTPVQSQGTVLLAPPFVLKFIQMGETAKDSLNTGSLHSSAFKGKDPSAMSLGELRKLIGKMSKNPEMHTFCSLDGSAAGDELSIQQYLNLDNEGVHEKEATPSIIIRYRKTEAKVSAAASKFHGASPEVLAAMERMKPDLSFKDRSADELKMDTSSFKVTEELQASQFAARDAAVNKFTSQMDEADWDAVLRNCSLLYGWKIDKKTNSIERARTPAFRLRSKASAVSSLPIPAPEPPAVTAGNTRAIKSGSNTPSSSSAASHDGSQSETGDESSAVAPPASTTADVPKVVSADDVHAPMPSKLGAVPSYVINDASKIDIVTVSSEFQECMAKNHFSGNSVEASVSGGYAGFSAGVSGGVASEKSAGQSSSNKTFAKKMVANYKFPRVTVYLRPEDLEPTQELREALENVKKTKNINDLRKLYSTFGHLFSQAATLGGCLQTTKAVSGTEVSAQTSEKEKFKADVGVAVSTPIGVGASVKASHDTQDSSDNSKKDIQTKESMSFEATGGNTILAADPPAWSGSVADFNNWRVIDQTDLSPIVEAIAQMPGCAQVRSWFFGAVPALSQYIVIPDSRTLNVRFKVACQGDSFERITGRGHLQAYLGLNPDKSPKPIRTSLERRAPESSIHTSFSFGTFGPVIDLTTTTTQVDVTSYDALFVPYSTQAPVLMFPQGDEVGTDKDASLFQTVWRLEVAQGHSLGQDTLVCIKSCAPVHTGGPQISSPELALSVYRNAQGIFLPTITSSDEPCYWRFRRVASGLNSDKDRFQHGDEVRLTWAFSDQAGGFRDYFGDVYGRRSFRRPAECATDVLALKIPYPRFEGPRDAGISLVMSPALTTEPVVATMPIRALPGENGRQERNYNLHDLSFRLDHVGNRGVGDASDFMNIVTAAHTEDVTVTKWEVHDQQVSPLQQMLGEGTPEAMVAGLLLGPAASPIGAVASVIGGIFDLF